MKHNRIIMVTLMISALLVFSGCSSQRNEIVDLDKVLDIMKSTLDELDATQTEGPYGDVSGDTIKPLDSGSQNPEYNRMFVERFSANLNNAKIASSPIGVSMVQDGSVEGFIDQNANNSKDINEKSIFKIEIDAERDRLIATDTQHQYRRSSGYSMTHGLFAGYFLSSMFGRQRGAGIMPSRFSNMKMSNNNYRTSSFFKKSARTSGGSRSFKSGK